MNFLLDMYKFGLARKLNGHLSEQPMGAFLDIHPKKAPQLVLHQGHEAIPHAVIRSGPKAFERPNLMFDSWANIVERDEASAHFWDRAESVAKAAKDRTLLASTRNARAQLDAGLSKKLQKTTKEPPKNWILLRYVGDEAPAFKRTAVNEYLKAQYTLLLKPDPDAPGVCMVTGKPSSIPDNYGFVRKMPGADSRGSGFLTWNDVTTCYMGRDGSENFPVGTGTWHTIQCAINYASFSVSNGVSRCLLSLGREDATDGVMWVCAEDDLDFLRVLMHRKFLHAFSKGSEPDWRETDRLVAEAWKDVERMKRSTLSVSLYGVSACVTRAGITDHKRMTVGTVCKNLLTFREAFEGDGAFNVGDAVYRFHEQWKKPKDGNEKPSHGKPAIGGRDMSKLVFAALTGGTFPDYLRGNMTDAGFRRNPAPYHFDVQSGWMAFANTNRRTA